jgi:PEP-CTERM motif
MKSLLVAFAALGTLAAASPTLAATVTFDTQPVVYFVPSVTDGGYIFTSTADGFGTNNESALPTNGTMHLTSWTNVGSESGFTMAALDGSVFTLNSFQFGGGSSMMFQTSGVTSLTVSGTGGQAAFSKTFTAGVDYTNFQMGTLFMDGQDATELTFTAFGSRNRASFDDFVVNSQGGVPEPASWAMMIFGLGAVGATMRRRGARMIVAAS